RWQLDLRSVPDRARVRPPQRLNRRPWRPLVEELDQRRRVRQALRDIARDLRAQLEPSRPGLASTTAAVAAQTALLFGYLGRALRRPDDQRFAWALLDRHARHRAPHRRLRRVLHDDRQRRGGLAAGSGPAHRRERRGPRAPGMPDLDAATLGSPAI